ncbi:hypothetical protein OEZ86_012832 [Tetradesmus obliquus]|nr:hypothetical protein OEZ86_012832 [Tetradesmus obliquus]
MLRKHCVQTTAKHPGAVKRTQQKTPNHKRVVKKRDIRTSFLRTPVAPSDWERELAAAAAHQQLLVVKVEAAQSLMRSSSRVDPTLRFQTNNSLPTALNTYAPHPELLSSFSLLGSAGPATPATFTSAYDFAPASLRGSSSSVVGAAAVSSSSQACQLDSPVHQWYQQLAGQYSSSRLRFLSLQSDAPRAKALCRRLGVGGPLSVLLVEPGSGRQVLQLVGNKVEAELLAALLYFGDVDAAGAAPSQLLPQLTSKEQLEAHTSSADVSVVAFHMHAAPPCVRSYSRIYEAARSSAGSIPFAVMDVDSSDACTALSNELGLERLPTLVVYKGGKEVCRLEKSSERKQLQEVLQQQVAASAAVAAA